MQHVIAMETHMPKMPTHDTICIISMSFSQKKKKKNSQLVFI